MCERERERNTRRETEIDRYKDKENDANDVGDDASAPIVAATLATAHVAPNVVVAAIDVARVAPDPKARKKF